LWNLYYRNRRTKGTLKLGKARFLKKITKHNLASAQLDTFEKKQSRKIAEKQQYFNWFG
jgi:hypothetical protein